MNYHNLNIGLAVMACFVAATLAYKEMDGLDALGYEDSNDAHSVCQIYNSKYKNWFIVAEKETFSGEKRNVTLGRYLLFSDDRQKEWKLYPVEGVKNGFYIKNSKYGEQIFATSSFTGFNPFTQKRRKIYTWRLSSDMQMDKKSFIWIITRTDLKPDEYYIYNLAYREPLYAGSWAYKGSLYTWHKAHEDHNQFRWILKCSTSQPSIE